MTTADFLAIAICTRDRPADLERALRSLAGQRDAESMDVLVVDNSDRRTAHDVWTRFGASFAGRTRYVHVTEPGLSVARNAALAEAGSTFVAFLDDDVTLPDDWHLSLAEGLRREGVVAAGGPIRLEWDGARGRPRWMRRSHEPLFSAVELGGDERDCDVRYERPYGANFAVHRGLALDLGGFASRLGRVSGRLVGGEDVDMIVRLAGRGSVRYIPGAWVRHHVAPERATRRWLLRRYFAQGKTEVYAGAAYSPPQRRRGLARLRRDPRVLPYRGVKWVGKLAARRELRGSAT